MWRNVIFYWFKTLSSAGSKLYFVLPVKNPMPKRNLQNNMLRSWLLSMAHFDNHTIRSLALEMIVIIIILSHRLLVSLTRHRRHDLLLTRQALCPTKPRRPVKLQSSLTYTLRHFTTNEWEISIYYLWSSRGLNSGPLACKASTLPLSYYPNTITLNKHFAQDLINSNKRGHPGLNRSAVGSSTTELCPPKWTRRLRTIAHVRTYRLERRLPRVRFELTT